LRASIIKGTDRGTIESHVQEHVAEGARVYTDELGSYRFLDELGYSHATVDHMECYVDGRVHTNGLENFWSLLKRGLNGTYISVQPFHLFRYLDERVFTFNLRGLDDYDRFATVLQAVTGRRLTYAELTGHAC